MQLAPKSDDRSEVGRHCFERAGLGRAPFKIVGSFECKFQAAPGAPVQPGGSCDYCGQGIMYAVAIKSADGKTFKVGCDCVARTGDAGLIKAYKQHPNTRAQNRARAKSLDDRKAAEWQELIADPTNREKLSAHFVPNWKNELRPWLELAEFAWQRCGASGRARYLKAAKNILAGNV
jgi:hypothetical protein